MAENSEDGPASMLDEKNDHIGVNGMENYEDGSHFDHNQRQGRGGGGLRGRGRGRGRGRARGGRDTGGPPQRSHEERLMERVSMMSGPTYDLTPRDSRETKFNGRCRLYVGNLAPVTTTDELRDLFSPFGEISELYVNPEKGFAFVRLDYRNNAEKAKNAVDLHELHGRNIRVKFAQHQAGIVVHNLNHWVTNELLEKSFSVFGEIERAVVIVDERGKSTGSGIIEFARKPAARLAIDYCQQNCYFLTSSLRPVIVTPQEDKDEGEGLLEKNLPKNHPEYLKEREVGPRLAQVGSFEHEYGQRWKQLYEMHRHKLEALEQDLKIEEEKMEAQMQFARFEHETELLREKLRQRELDHERRKREWEMKEQEQEEMRRAQEESRARLQDDMQARIQKHEEDMKRRQQENRIFMESGGQYGGPLPNNQNYGGGMGRGRGGGAPGQMYNGLGHMFH